MLSDIFHNYITMRVRLISSKNVFLLINPSFFFYLKTFKKFNKCCAFILNIIYEIYKNKLLFSYFYAFFCCNEKFFFVPKVYIYKRTAIIICLGITKLFDLYKAIQFTKTITLFSFK